MASSLQTLIKILSLEQQKEYQNKAVIGGLGRFAYHWAREAHSQAKSDSERAVIEAISDMLRNYDGLPVDARPAALKEISALAHGQQVESAPEHAQPDSSAAPLAVGEATQTAPGGDEPDLGIAPSEVQERPFEDTSVAGSAAVAVAAPVSVRERRGYALQEPALMTEELSKRLAAPVASLTNIGEKRAELLARVGIKTIGDALFSVFPRRHDDFSHMKLIRQLKLGEEVTVIGTLARIQTIRPKQGVVRVEAYLEDDSGALRLNWFNQPWLEKKLKDGAPVVVSGKVEQYLGRLVMNAPEIEPLESEWLQAGRIVPVYPLTKGLYGKLMRRLAKHVVDTYAARLPDHLPVEVRQHADLMDYGDAIAQAHFPDSQDDLAAAKRRLAFDELFVVNMIMLRQRRRWQGKPAVPLSADDAWLDALKRGLPYQLTGAQERAIDDIRRDASASIPMNRLLQGDVGSGKTVVATVAIAVALANGKQSVLMAPTSILAEQHFRTVSALLNSTPLGGGLNIALLTGKTAQAERATIYAGLADGSIHVVIGTHALIQPDVRFAHLALAVIDEQHRFGVLQRAALREKAEGGNPHLLVMTATPIPRTLALTLHADLDLSVIDEMPPGRQPVDTRVLQPKERERAYAFLKGQIQQGHQAFIIYPLIEDNERTALRAATAEYTRLQNSVFPDLALGLLHGRMRPADKEAVMERFYQGELNILVTTSVIEVGIDVSNATVMMVENANRFGLAQLHQFRGRVGRGEHKGYCLLMSEQPFLDGDDRLRAVEETSDGFRLAQIDWELRGAGDLLGVRQSGLARFHHADFMDSHLVETVQREARFVFERDPDLALPEHRPLLERLRPHRHEGDIS